MILIFKTVINTKIQKNIFLALQAIFGLGLYRSQFLILKLTGRLFNKTKIFRKIHYRLLQIKCKTSLFLIKEKLKTVKRINIRRLKLIGNYKGLRHSFYLPANGQRTKSNAITPRFLGTGGSFDYIPRIPTKTLKKIGSYIKHSIDLKIHSEERYKLLLKRNFNIFQKTYGRLTRYLNHKGQLGVFSKFVKSKKKIKIKNKVKPKKIKNKVK
jgi:small subunit ribosomal protein S13